MRNTSQVQGLEKQFDDAKTLIGRRDLALKLAGNRDFKKLILEDYCIVESARLVHQSADPALEPLVRADALNMAQAAGHLKRFLQMMIQMGDNAENNFAALEEALAEARAQEDAPEADGDE